MSSPERIPSGAERGVEAAATAAAERAAELRKSAERSGEQSPENAENRIAAERKEVEAVFAKEHSPAERKSGQLDGDAAPVRKATTKSERKASYKRTMKRVQSEMSPAERTFSKVIHQPVVDKASDIVGGTVARPNALLAGSLTAFLLVTAVYVVAKNYGYRLSGFETIAAFIVGWVLGQLFDYLRVMVTGKR